jgi:hypothetical protein
VSTPFRIPFLFTRRNVQPPAELYVQQDDALIVDIWTTTGVNFEARARILTATGQIASLRTPILATGSVGFLQRFTLPLPEGCLLGASLYETINTDPYGTIFARLHLGTGLTVTPFTAQLLAADFVSGNYGPTYPTGRIVHPLEGPGFLHTIVGATPAAGAEISETAPLFVARRLRHITALLTTSAAPGNRTPSIQIQGAVGVGVFRSQFAFTNAQPPSTTQRYSLFPGAALSSFGGANSLSLPDHAFSAPLTWGTATNGLAATDTWTTVRYEVQDYLLADG